MILGYIFGFSLSYVGIWLINAGFTRVYNDVNSMLGAVGSALQDQNTFTQVAFIQWTSIFIYFFGVVTYTTMIIQVVTKSYDLIFGLPDKITRWLGGQQESTGSESAMMAKDVKDQSQQGAGQLKSGVEDSAATFSKKTLGGKHKGSGRTGVGNK